MISARKLEHFVMAEAANIIYRVPALLPLLLSSSLNTADAPGAETNDWHHEKVDKKGTCPG